MSENEPGSMHEAEMAQQHLAVVLVAAGSSSRMGGDVPKQFRDFAGLPLFAHSLQTLRRCGLAERFVIVVPAEWQDRLAPQLKRAGVPDAVVVAGGVTRQQSVRNGLEAISRKAWPVTHVLVHDAARPFVSEEMVRAVIAAVHETGAATLAIPVSDTLMRAAPVPDQGDPQSHEAGELIDRNGMWAIQTPQVFELQLLRRAHEKAPPTTQATDDGTLILELGGKLHFVPGAWWNIKVTHPEDFEKARLIAAIRRVPSMQFPDSIPSEQGGKA